MTPGQNLASDRDGDHGSLVVLAVLALIVGAVSGLVGALFLLTGTGTARSIETLAFRADGAQGRGFRFPDFAARAILFQRVRTRGSENVTRAPPGATMQNQTTRAPLADSRNQSHRDLSISCDETKTPGCGEITTPCPILHSQAIMPGSMVAARACAIGSRSGLAKSDWDGHGIAID
jgi:hypothetical protein